ncbi:MAG: hypothetical protein LUE92_04730 [Clostridiales bacterium]|nr:hypothetical protein [Clostridiales bacterium]
MKSGKKLPFPIKEDDILYRHFFTFINDFNHTSVPSLRYEELVIDNKFDDYIECDYWDFTLMAIRKWKLEKELYTALEGSLALYDCDDMAVFIKDAGKVDFVSRNENIILDTLQKYSDFCVKYIKVYAAKMRTKAV